MIDIYFILFNLIVDLKNIIFISAFVCLPRPDPDPVRGELLEDDPEDAGVVRPSSAGEKFCLRQFELSNAKTVQRLCCRLKL